MNTATHTVEVPFPQAFPGLTSWLFPSAPRYRRNGVPYAERDHQAVRRDCALLRDSTLALSLFPGQHGRVFTPGPVPGNPPKRDSVVSSDRLGFTAFPPLQTGHAPFNASGFPDSTPEESTL